MVDEDNEHDDDSNDDDDGDQLSFNVLPVGSGSMREDSSPKLLP